MSTRTVLVSDLSGQQEATRITLGHAGEWREIDLTEPEKRDLESLLEPYINAGRWIGPTLTPVKKRVVPETTAAERDEIRDWGHKQGFEFSDYGRIPKRVYNAYLAAHKSESA